MIIPKYEVIAVYISVLAIIVSIGTAIYSSYQGKILASSDFKAKELIKSDTAKLLSTLRSLMYKGALTTTGFKPEDVDISKEKSSINDFLNSETGFAYYSWVNEKDTIAKQQGKNDEGWRSFFLNLALLANTDNPYSAAQRAAEIEILFDNFTEEDASRIAEFNSDLNKAISQVSKNRGGNTIIMAFIERARNRSIEFSPENFLKKLNYLKSLGIEDPNVDMFIAVLEGNVPKLEAALASGADTSTTDSALTKKYANELKNYTE